MRWNRWTPSRRRSIDRVGHDWLHRLGQTRLPVCSENGYELDARAEEARLDAPFAAPDMYVVW